MGSIKAKSSVLWFFVLMFISSFLWQRRENAFHKNCITIFSYFTFLGFSDSFKFSTQFL
uniref:Uncharacterized protein n=1 Tax=Oryza brachyantha TaxID=4533 RepID=J3N1L4_ORYBR